MFCSGCGQQLVTGQGFCAQCGRPAAAPVPPVPGLEFQLERYAGQIKTLSILWFVYSALSLLAGIVGVSFLHHIFSNGFGFMNAPPPPDWLGPIIVHFAIAATIVRFALALAAGWGLMERRPWGRVVAIIAAVFCLLKVPFGTALGIWTLVVLLGYRNTTLYEQL